LNSELDLTRFSDIFRASSAPGVDLDRAKFAEQLAVSACKSVGIYISY
jgi:hypothetical protein